MVENRLVDEAYTCMYVLANTVGGELALKAARRFRRRLHAWESVHEMYWDRRQAEEAAAARMRELRKQG